jgi:hypothetical protein
LQLSVTRSALRTSCNGLQKIGERLGSRPYAGCMCRRIRRRDLFGAKACRDHDRADAHAAIVERHGCRATRSTCGSSPAAAPPAVNTDAAIRATPTTILPMPLPALAAQRVHRLSSSPRIQRVESRRHTWRGDGGGGQRRKLFGCNEFQKRGVRSCTTASMSRKAVLPSNGTNLRKWGLNCHPHKRHFLKSSKNSDTGSTPVTSRWSRDRVQAT